MKKEYIVLIPTSFNNAKEIAFDFKGKEFKSLGEACNAVTDVLTNDEDEEDEEVLVYTTDFFVEGCNSQEINLENYFISNVFINQN